MTRSGSRTIGPGCNSSKCRVPYIFRGAANAPPSSKSPHCRTQPGPNSWKHRIAATAVSRVVIGSRQSAGLLLNPRTTEGWRRWGFPLAAGCALPAQAGSTALGGDLLKGRQVEQDHTTTFKPHPFVFFPHAQLLVRALPRHADDLTDFTLCDRHLAALRRRL